MSTAPVLPKPFTHLESWLPFALPSEDARMRRRLSASMDELLGLYKALVGEMPSIAEHLDQWPLVELPAEQKPLLYLALSFMESAMAVEAFHQPGPPHATTPESMVVFPGRAEQMLSRG
nr:J568 [uncultured bacterium]